MLRRRKVLARNATTSVSAAKPTRTEVILLGTGTPYPDPAASGPATAVVVGGRVLLFDAGPGVMRRLKAANLPISGPEALFITHLHSDHTLGYADLILTSWVMRRRAPFPVYGPRGLRRMTDHLLAAYSEDIDIRTNGLEHEVAGGYHVDAHEIRAGVVYQKDGVRVSAIPVEHGAWKDAFALSHRHGRSLDRDFGRHSTKRSPGQSRSGRRHFDPRSLFCVTACT